MYKEKLVEELTYHKQIKKQDFIYYSLSNQLFFFIYITNVNTHISIILCYLIN